MNLKYYSTVDEIENQIKSEILPTQIVVDIGCGIYPINYFVPSVHILVEPWGEYIEVLESRYKEDSRNIILKSDGVQALRIFNNKSVDSIFVIDVIEHMSKLEGNALIEESIRVAKSQIVVFTPLGFMPQHISVDKKDRWGLNGGALQEHKSGWIPEDFGDEWDFHICKEFHKFDKDGVLFDKPFGAFYAILNLPNQPHEPSAKYENFFRPTAKDVEIAKMNLEIAKLEYKLRDNEARLIFIRDQYEKIVNSTTWKITYVFRRIIEVCKNNIKKRN